MRRAAGILLFVFVWLSVVACTSTGADKRMSAPVDSVGETEEVETRRETGVDGIQENRFDSLYSVAMTGDIMMGTTYPDTVLPADSGRWLFKDVRSVLRKADIAVGNLEGTLCDTGTTTKKKSALSYAFRTPTCFVSRLSEAGYDFLSLANNHSNDFGRAGMLSTERALRGEGIGFAGFRGRRRFSIVRRNGVRFGLCAFGHNHYTLRMQDFKTVETVLDSLQRRSDIIIVSVHGGGEGAAFSHLPDGKETFIGEDRGSLRAFARFCVDHGADVVYGHGPHVVRCVELYKGRFIAYSLGNFCTPYGINVSGVSGFAPVIEAKVNSEGRFVEGRIHSFIQRRGRGPRRDTANIVARHIRSLTAADAPSAGVTITDDGQIKLK